MQLALKGTTTHFQKIGQGPNLVLLHGWGCTWEIWSPVIARLSESFTLIIPDLPGFGKSEPAEQAWNSYQYAEWLEEFLHKTVAHQKFIVLGHSFGGKIASLYASYHANKNLRHLIILDASGLPDTLPKQKQLQQQLIAMVPDSVKNAIPFKLKQRIFKTLRASDDYLVATPYQKQVLRKILSEHLAKDLAKISVPTAIWWGKLDGATPLHQGQQFQAFIPHSTLTVFEKSGHYPFVDETEKFITELEKFA